MTFSASSTTERAPDNRCMTITSRVKCLPSRPPQLASALAFPTYPVSRTRPGRFVLGHGSHSSNHQGSRKELTALIDVELGTFYGLGHKSWRPCSALLLRPSTPMRWRRGQFGHSLQKFFSVGDVGNTLSAPQPPSGTRSIVQFLERRKPISHQPERKHHA